MRITIAYRYFWPDTPPYAEMLKHITAWLVEAGHDVRIITAQPSYKPEAGIPKQPAFEVIDGVEVTRVPLLNERGSNWKKLLNSFLFIFQAFFRVLFGKKTDLVWTATMPPVLQAFMLMVAGKIRGAEFLYHMQDIHPELSVASNVLKNDVITRIMTSIDRFSQRLAWRIIVLSDDMRESVIKRGLEQQKVLVLRNFSLGVSEGQELAKSPGKGEPVIFVFAGNIGRFQNLEALVEAFEDIPETDARLVFVGEGRTKKGLLQIVTDKNVKNVEFHDHMSASDVFKLMCGCHVGVISLLPGIYRYAFPSKLLTYMAANLPMLALVEDESALARLLQEHNIGKSVSWDKSNNQMAETIHDAMVLAQSGKANPAKIKQYYHPDVARKNWIELLKTLESGDAK